MPLRQNCLSFIPVLKPVEMNGIELPDETRFRLLGLAFTRYMDWKPYIQSIAKAASRKVGSLYRAHRFLTPGSILYLYKSTIYNFGIGRCTILCTSQVEDWGDPNRIRNRYSTNTAMQTTHSNCTNNMLMILGIYQQRF